MNRIKELRLEKKLSQIHLAMDLNTTQASVSKYELNKSFPDIEMLIKMSRYFSVSIDYLLGLSPFRTNAETPELTEMDMKCLNLFNCLTTEQKKQALSYMRGLSGH